MPPKEVPATKRAVTLRALQIKLKCSKVLFNDICNFADSLEETTPASQVTVRLTKLDELWESVNEVIMDIEQHDDYTAEDDSYSKELVDVSNRYYTAKALLLDRAKEFEEASTTNQTTRGLDTSLYPTVDHVRLPQIKLQTFDGNIDEWLSFRDLYSSLIHSKTDLPDVEKFHYLKGCLAGEAKALINPLAITQANYTIAWETLTKRYNDSKLLKKRQVQAFFNLPTLTRESATDLQSLLEGFERIVQTLDQIVQPADYKDLLLLHILCARLDTTTRRSWEEHSASQEQDAVKDLMKFLHKRIRVLGSLPIKTEHKFESYQSSRRKQPPARTSYSVVQASGVRCVACSESHLLYQCPKFQKMRIYERDRLLRSNLLCRNCFKRGHIAAECRSWHVCRNCKAKHHTMICLQPEDSQGAKRSPQRTPPRRRSPQRRSPPRRSPQTRNQDNRRNANSNTASISVSSNVADRRTSSVLLATAVVLVEDDEGFRYPARALLDSGSECNFMSNRLSHRLKVRRERSDVSVLGIGQANMRVKHKVAATIRSRVSAFSRKMDFLLLPNVTANLPTTDVEVASWKIPEGVELADPAFFKSQAVDLVLGIENFFAFFEKGSVIQLGEELLRLTESVFGWVVSGAVDASNRASYTTCNMAVSANLEDLLVRFWACEEIGTSDNYSPEERRCEEQYVRSIQRGPDGRYTVSLPKNEDALARIGESRDIAFRRLQCLERRRVALLKMNSTLTS